MSKKLIIKQLIDACNAAGCTLMFGNVKLVFKDGNIIDIIEEKRIRLEE